MKSRNIKLSIKDKELYTRIIESNHASDLAKKKAKVILARDNNKTIDQITKEIGISKRTVINYIKGYIEAKDKLYFIHKKTVRMQSILDSPEYKDKISELFNSKTSPPISYQEAKDRIFEKLGINISKKRVWVNLKKRGIYTYRTKTNVIKRYNTIRKLKTATKKYKESLKDY